MRDERPAQTELVDFDTLADLLLAEGLLTLSPAELHGLICGQLAGGARFDAGALLARVGELLDLKPFRQEALRSAIGALYLATLHQLEAPDFSLELLLPDDDQPLAVRADALGLWCGAFLSGVGLQERQGGQTLSLEAQEALRDLTQIAQITTAADAAAEEDENDLMEVEEYVRMVALLLFSECNQPDGRAGGPQPETAPVLH
ncbi:MAG: UPF0149 family protein [Pseudomonadota bacterium]|jgi:uncharacterized protein YgfB (UPF0149 family)|nr:UPF0149 family protein [Pseudomonadota bacterium]